MREILFRAKRMDNFEWVEGLIQINLNSITEYVIYDSSGIDYIVFPETVGQFTGLTDKNGNKIFEGDIITCGDSNIKYEVIWNDTGLKAQQIGNLSKIGLQYWIRKIEIIGNIHDKQ